MSVRLSPSDLAKITKAARQMWPGAIMSQSAIVLGLALRGAASVEADKKRS